MAEVKTRSGGFPSVPYVRLSDGTWVPKYVAGKPNEKLEGLEDVSGTD